MEATRKFPYDFDSLDKGSVITSIELCEIFGCKPTDKPYRFAVLGLADQIEKHFKREFNQVITTRQLGDDLHVCTDEVASEVNQKRFQKDLRALLRDHDRLLGVDMTKLSCDQVRGHRTAIVNQSRIVQSLHSGMKRRSITTAIPVQAATPG